MDKLIITVAGVGAETTKEAQPNSADPRPEEIGVEAARCRKAGAEHVPPARPRRRRACLTQSKDVFAAAIAEIRDRTDIIVQTCTGGAMGMTRGRATGAAGTGPRDGLADDRHRQLRRRRVLQRRGADRRRSTPACRPKACGRSSRASSTARSTTRCAWSRSSAGRPADALGLRARGSRQHDGEPRNLVFLVDSHPRRGLHLDLHRHRPLAPAGDADGPGPRRQRTTRLRGQRLLPQGRARREQRAARAARGAPRARAPIASPPRPTRHGRSCSCRPARRKEPGGGGPQGPPPPSFLAGAPGRPQASTVLATAVPRQYPHRRHGSTL